MRPPDASPAAIPDFVGFYRWHLPDPVVFADDLRVTIQQIGAASFPPGADIIADEYFSTNPPAGRGVLRDVLPGVGAFAICERVDDYCGTAFVYARDAQPAPRVDVSAAVADLERRSYERADAMESFFGS